MRKLLIYILIFTSSCYAYKPRKSIPLIEQQRLKETHEKKPFKKKAAPNIIFWSATLIIISVMYSTKKE